MIKNLSCFLLLFLIALETTLAQGADNPLGLQVLPPSPEMAAMAKYGEVPVSYYTGLPTVAIPLGDINGRELNTSFSLTYHAGGIKVEETPSRAGLGWTFNAEGTITRVVRGLPDESGWLTNSVDPDSVLNMSTVDRDNYLDDVLSGNYDSEPDVYYFNFNGRSGQFFFDKHGAAVVSPGMDIEIEWGGVSDWTITDERGTKFYFGKTSSSTRSSKEITQVDSFCGGNSTLTTGWYLTEMISAFNTDTVSFHYSPYSIDYCTKDSESDYLNVSLDDDCQKSPKICGSKKTITGNKLRRVVSSLGKVEIVYGLPRLDLPGDSTLLAVKHYNFGGDLIKSFDLDHDYFTSSGSLTNYGYCASVTSDEARRKRLKLLKVTETDGTSQIVPPYEFEYNSTNLPERFSNAQDHWGYYNGKDNAKLIPDFEYHSGSTHMLLEGADRRPDTIKVKASVLEKITYPTGGYTTFEYESNTGTTPFLEPNKDIVNTSSLLGDGVMQLYELLFSISMNYTNGAFVDPNISGVSCDPLLSSCDISFKIEGITDTSFEKYLTTVSENVYLPNGDYKLVVQTGNSNNDSKFFGISLSWLQDYLSDTRIAGGLRVKRITTSDGTTNGIDLVKRFVYEDDQGVSYGQTGSFPSYEYLFQEYQGSVNAITCSFYARSSTSSIPLATSSGSYVGYSRVHVLEGNNGGNGKTVYHFSNFSESPDAWDNTYPYTPTISRDYGRGLLQETEMFKQNNGTYYLARKIMSTYQDKLIAGQENSSLAFIAYRDPVNILNLNPLPIVPPKFYEDYIIHSGLKLAAQQKTIDYSYSNNFTTVDSVVTVQQIEYGSNNHRNPTVVTTYGSDYPTISKTKYTVDFDPGVSSAIASLQNNHVLDPVENQVWKVSGSDTIMVKGTLNTYAQFSGITRREEVKSALILPKVLSSGVSEPQNSSNLFTSLLPNGISYQTEVLFNDYDLLGKPLKYTDNKGLDHILIWKYNNSLLAGHFVNAALNQVDFLDFEEGESVDWTGFNTSFINSTTALTGRNGYDGSISKNLPQGEYKILVAAVGNGGTITVNGSSHSTSDKWGVFHWKLSASNIQITPSSGVVIDHVRIYPANAEANSISYLPGIGVVAEMDPNGKITTYQYDQNRLSLIRDYNGKILTKYQYNFLSN